MISCRISTGISVLVGLVVVAALGCGETVPIHKTYAVRGKVLRKNGEPFSGGAIQFQSASNPNLSAMGEIQADGSYALSSFAGDQKLDGAAEGSYRVTIVPPMPPDQNVEPITLPKEYTVQPQDNEITITLNRS